MAIQANNIREHMEIVGSDRQHVGKVDRVEGGRIKLAKSDKAAGGEHHYVSLDMIESIEGERVILNQTCEQARQQWKH